MVAYVPCGRCWESPDQPAAVEEAIIAGVAAELAKPEAN
jgi:hypothetical protein